MSTVLGKTPTEVLNFAASFPANQSTTFYTVPANNDYAVIIRFVSSGGTGTIRVYRGVTEISNFGVNGITITARFNTEYFIIGRTISTLFPLTVSALSGTTSSALALSVTCPAGVTASADITITRWNI